MKLKTLLKDVKTSIDIQIQNFAANVGNVNYYYCKSEIDVKMINII